MQPDLHETSARVSRMNIEAGNLSHPRQEGPKRQNEVELEPGYSSPAAAPPSQICSDRRILSQYRTVKDDIPLCRTRISAMEQTMAAESDRYRKGMRRYLKPIEMLDIVTERHRAGIQTTKQHLDRIQEDIVAILPRLDDLTTARTNITTSVRGLEKKTEISLAVSECRSVSRAMSANSCKPNGTRRTILFSGMLPNTFNSLASH